MILLAEHLPEFAGELRRLLTYQPDLEASIGSLSIVDKCRCGDVFCASFYTMPPPKGAWGPGHENIVLDPADGWVILDVIDGRIGMVEVLYRQDVKDSIEKLIP